MLIFLLKIMKFMSYAVISMDEKIFIIINQLSTKFTDELWKLSRSKSRINVTSKYSFFTDLTNS
jgi:hypothetical protein